MDINRIPVEKPVFNIEWQYQTLNARMTEYQNRIVWLERKNQELMTEARASVNLVNNLRQQNARLAEAVAVINKLIKRGNSNE